MNPKIKELEKEINSIIVERQETVRGLMTALLSRQHLFVVGPPGTAKSEMIRLLASSIKGSKGIEIKKFDILMTRFTTPEEVVGPIKFSALKQDKFERQVVGYLPDCHFAFIDEIWKSSSSILNALLTILNERMFKMNGEMKKVNLETCMSASNEIPSDREELSALWDRFLLRYKVGYIQEDANFVAMLKQRLGLNSIPRLKTRITLDELHAMQEEVKKVEISDSLIDLVTSIRKSLLKEGIIASDRRYHHLFYIVKAHAYLEGRMKAIEDDIEIMKYGLWDTPEQMPKVGKIIITSINPMQEKADEIYDAILSALKSIDDEKDENAKRTLFAEVTGKTNKFLRQLEEIEKSLKADGKDTTRVREYINQTIANLQEKGKELFNFEIKVSGGA